MSHSKIRQFEAKRLGRIAQRKLRASGALSGNRARSDNITQKNIISKPNIQFKLPTREQPKFKEMGIFKAIKQQQQTTGKGFLSQSINKVRNENRFSILDSIFARLRGRN